MLTVSCGGGGGGEDHDATARRLIVPGLLTLDDVHACLRVVFGAQVEPARRYVFSIGERRFLPLVPDQDPQDDRIGDAEFTCIDDLDLQPGAELRYLHDFAAERVHRITVDLVLPARGPERLPRCVAIEREDGRRQPPDDELESINRRLAKTFAALAEPGLSPGA